MIHALFRAGAGAPHSVFSIISWIEGSVASEALAAETMRKATGAFATLARPAPSRTSTVAA